jgi:hypothetical protein
MLLELKHAIVTMIAFNLSQLNATIKTAKSTAQIENTMAKQNKILPFF